MKNFTGIAILFLIPAVLFGSISDIDSLILGKTDIEKLDILIEQCVIQLDTNPSEAIECGEEALKIANRLKDDFNQAKILSFLARAYYFIEESTIAIQYSDHALRIVNEVPINPGKLDEVDEIRKRIHVNLANTYLMLTAEYNLAMQQFMKLGEIAERTQDDYYRGYAVMGMGMVNRNLKNHEAALEHFTQAAVIFEDIGEETQLVSALNEAANMHLFFERFDHSLQLRSRALNIAEKNDYKYGISFVTHDKGYTYYVMKDYTSALAYFQQSMDVSTKYLENRDLSIVLGNMARCYNKLGDYSNALKYNDDAFELAEKVNSRHELRTIYETYSSIFQNIGDYRRAYENHLHYCELGEAIFADERTKQIVEMQAKYESEKQKLEISNLKRKEEQQQIIQYAILIFLLAALIVIYTLIKSNQFRKKANSQLRSALQEVKTLSGLLPICARCKKIRDDGGYWQQIEEYVQDHSDADFSHSICPECLAELYPELNGEDADNEASA